jgi:hypothetical protein
MARTCRQSWTEGLLPAGVGLGEGLAEREAVVLGEGEAEALLLGLAEALVVGLAGALPLGVAVALGEGEAGALLLGVADALLVGSGVAVALLAASAAAVVMAVPLARADLPVLAMLALAGESQAASRTTADWLAGMEWAAEVAAGGWPHPLDAAAFTVAAPAAVPPRRRPPAMPAETMAAPATTPNMEKADQADLMTAPSRCGIFAGTSRVRLASTFTVRRNHSPMPGSDTSRVSSAAAAALPDPHRQRPTGTTPCGNLPSPSCDWPTTPASSLTSCASTAPAGPATACELLERLCRGLARNPARAHRMAVVAKVPLNQPILAAARTQTCQVRRADHRRRFW